MRLIIWVAWEKPFSHDTRMIIITRVAVQFGNMFLSNPITHALRAQLKLNQQLSPVITKGKKFHRMQGNFIFSSAIHLPIMSRVLCVHHNR